MKSFVRTVYSGEDREETLDWIIVNERNQICLSVHIRDDQLLNARILETHGLECVDPSSGVATADGIAPNGVLHVSARIVPTGKSQVHGVGLVYADKCIRLCSED